MSVGPSVDEWKLLADSSREHEARLRKLEGEFPPLDGIAIPLRDRFAMAALSSMGPLSPDPREPALGEFCVSMYRYADAMLAAREVRCHCTHEAGDSPCPMHGEEE